MRDVMQNQPLSPKVHVVSLYRKICIRVSEEIVLCCRSSMLSEKDVSFLFSWNLQAMPNALSKHKKNLPNSQECR